VSVTDTTIIEHFVGLTSPSLLDTITLAGFDFTTVTASKFSMRPYSSSTLTINAASETMSNQTIGSMNTTYNWQVADVGTAGLYVAWHTLTIGAATQDTPQFYVYLVDPLGVAPSGDLCTLNDVRVAMSLQDGFTDSDPQIALSISMATAAIIQEGGREFAPVSTNLKRRFMVERVPGAVVHFGPYDLQSASLVQLNPETSSPTTLTTLQDYSFEPIQSRSGTYKQLRMAPTAPIFSTVAVKYNYALLDITGTWGFPTVPPDIRHGCIETVRSWLDKAVQDYGARDLVDLPRDIIATAAQSYDLPIAALKAVRRWQDWTP